MKSLRSLALAAVVAMTTIGAVHAQYDLGLGTATLTINGQTPSVANPATHEVQVGATWTVAIADPANAGAGFILVADLGTAPAAFPTPWGGSVDMAAPTVVLDGLGFSQSAFDFLATLPFSMTLPLNGPACAAVTGPSVQAITGDATNAPFFLRNTQVGQPARNAVTTTTVSGGNIGDDVAIAVPVSGVKYCGQVYTQLFVGSNGQITFQAGSTDFSPSTAEFANGFRAATATGVNRGVAPIWGDFARSTALTDTVTVTDDVPGGVVTVAYNNQAHWSSQTAAGSWSVTFDCVNDAVSFDLSGYLAGTATDGIRITGVSVGSNVGSTLTLGPIAALPGGSGYTTGVAPSVAVAPESICESITAATLPSTPTYTCFHTGGVVNDFVWTVVFP